MLAYDEQASRVVPRAVTATFAHPDQEVGAVPLSDGRVLHVTANHPIYLPDQRRYADAGELAGDERLLTLSASAQTSSLIAGAFHASGTDPVTVYNITVAGEHNYFAEGVLVHNKSPPFPDGGCPPVSFDGECTLNLPCLNPERPTPEYVGLNQPAGARPNQEDAGPVDPGSHDAGPPDSGVTDSGPVQRTSTDVGVEIPSPNAGATVCAWGDPGPRHRRTWRSTS